MACPPPGLFTTATGMPAFRDSSSVCSSRAVASKGPPGGVPTTISTGLPGRQSAASAGAPVDARKKMPHAHASHCQMFVFITVPFVESNIQQHRGGSPDYDRPDRGEGAGRGEVRLHLLP